MAEQTVRVKLKVGRVGSIDGRPWAQDPGQIVTVGAKEAERMIEAGQCEIVRDGPNYEKRS